MNLSSNPSPDSLARIPHPIVEIVCCSVDDCVETYAAGAHRIELCSAIPLGGLTPSLGLLREAKSRVPLPIMAMVRPRGAGMHYTEGEWAHMEQDAAIFRENGADGIVFGALTADGEVDLARCRRMVELAGPLTTVFHRAFDVTPDPFAALEQLIDAGVTRVLTSGQRPSVIDGADLVKALIDRADGRIEVLPGAGILPENVRDFVAKTGTKQIHLASYRFLRDTSTQHNPEIDYGTGAVADHAEYGLTNREAVATIVASV